MTTAMAVAKPSKLAESRRWVNTTKLTQSVQNFKRDDFVRVESGCCVQGAQFAQVCKQPTFQEVLDHLKVKELINMVKQEADIDLLGHLSSVERYSSNPRPEVQEAFAIRIAQLENSREKE